MRPLATAHVLVALAAALCTASPAGASPAGQMRPSGAKPAAATGPAGTVPVVVIDPGHGGSNLGASSARGKLREKDLTLQIARQLAQALRRGRSGAVVQLTRDRDEYLTLSERVRRANTVTADVFISIHLNASETGREQGFETYLLSREASAREAARLALLERGDRRGRDATVQTILTELRQSAVQLGSLELARAVQHELRRVRGPERDRGIRQAAFDVLLGLRVPGVLVELGFLDNGREGAELANEQLQARLAGALSRAIESFLAKQRGY